MRGSLTEARNSIPGTPVIAAGATSHYVWITKDQEAHHLTKRIIYDTISL